MAAAAGQAQQNFYDLAVDTGFYRRECIALGINRYF